MVFLIGYDRKRSKLVSFCEFDESSRTEVEILRLNLKIELNRKMIEHEIVVLVAASKAALRKTHARYFESLRQLSLAPA